ncbi:MAG: hypothetical protein JWO30_4648 [Fibrobacteres bacterium]|nr:hypothetical protein [Fibrobacterota bacterium]
MFHSRGMFLLKKTTWIAGALLASASYGDFLREPLKDPGLECNMYDSEGWLTIFDGTQPTAEKYWWISNSSHGDGGHWWVAEDPVSVTAGKLKAGQKVLWSDQNPGGNGGLLYTQRRYKDVDFRVTYFPGWENDGGIFLRSNGKGQAWQVMLDYQPGGTMGGIWPEGVNGPSQDYYSLATEIKVDARLAKWNMADWSTIWDADGYNMMQTRVTGNPGLITAFMHDSAHPVTNYQTTAQSVITETGYIGLQIHAGTADWKGGPNKYAKMQVRELEPGTGAPLCKPTVSVLARKAEGMRLSSQANGSGGLTVSGFAEGDYTLSLLDLHGRILEKRSGRGGDLFQEFAGLDKGIYVVNLATPKGSFNRKAVRF